MNALRQINSRSPLALAMALALTLQLLLSGVAMARMQAGGDGLVICTADGVRIVPAGAGQHAPGPGHAGCACATLCHALGAAAAASEPGLDVPSAGWSKPAETIYRQQNRPQTSDHRQRPQRGPPSAA